MLDVLGNTTIHYTHTNTTCGPVRSAAQLGGHRCGHRAYFYRNSERHVKKKKNIEEIIKTKKDYIESQTKTRAEVEKEITKKQNNK